MIANLGKPGFKNELFYQDETKPLISKNYLDKWMKENGKDLWWDNNPASLDQDRVFIGYKSKKDSENIDSLNTLGMIQF